MVTSFDDSGSITLDAWHQASRVSFRSVTNDFSCIEICNCVLGKSAEDVTELTSSDETITDITVWVYNAVYSLTNNDKETVLSPSGWLNDSIISAAQNHVTAFPSHVSTYTSACLGLEILYKSFMFTTTTGVSFLILDVRMV